MKSLLAEKPKGEQLKAMQVDTTIFGLDDERAKEMPSIASMGIYVISKHVMLDLLREKFPGANDFGSEVIPGAISLGLRVQAYLYDGYWEDIGTIEAFYNANLGITKSQSLTLVSMIALLLYVHTTSVYTSFKDA